MPRAQANGIDIEYEITGSGEPLLLIMGLNCQLVHWPDDFCDTLAGRGFQVLRFDNRDAGRSTWLDHLPAPNALGSALRAMVGLRFTPPYSLADMSDDAAGLLDALGLDSAHVAGVSMGGMIAQTLAARHPGRVRSLTSIMSGPGGPRSLIGHPRAMYWLLRPYPDDEEAALEQSVELFRVIGSTGFPYDEELMRGILRRAMERGDNDAGFLRQLAAICAAGNRSRTLAGIRCPTVVIHGAADPLMLPRNGRMTAQAIPGARLLMIEGMGHDLPRGAWPRIADAISGLARPSG